MLKAPGINAVGVFTPAPLHVWMAWKAMKADKQVISAVDAGLSIEEFPGESASGARQHNLPAIRLQ